MSQNQNPERVRRNRRPLRVCAPGWLAWVLVLHLAHGALGADEPQFEGKSISVWLQQLEKTRAFNWLTHELDITDPDAARAVREIGNAGVPFLLDHLRKGIAASEEYDRTAGSLPEAEQIKLNQKILPLREAEAGFKALGEGGASAVPDLTQLMWEKEDEATWVLQCLADIGPSAVPALQSALGGTNAHLRYHAAAAAGTFGERGAPLVPQLLGMLTNSASLRFERSFSAAALGRIGEPAQAILPALRDALSSTAESVPENACLGLMFMGKKAEPAIPDIASHLKRKTGQIDGVMLSALVVLSGDDERIAAMLKKDFQVEAFTFADVFVVIRQFWTNPTDRDRREAMTAAIARIHPLAKPK
jgi:hypothetical protein